MDESEPPTPKKTTRVFVLLGQSNMVGMGTVQGADTEGTLQHAVQQKKLYRYLVDAATGEWKEVVDPSVRNIFTMGSGNDPRDGVRQNELLTVKHSRMIGPEIGIGCVLGRWRRSEAAARTPTPNGSSSSSNRSSHPNDEIETVLLKSCIGNRSLGWDLLPPGSPSFEHTEPSSGKKWTYAGYGQSPSRWEAGTDPVPDPSWHAGEQYDGDVRRARRVLEGLSGDGENDGAVSVAGFFFWQGDKDRYDLAYAGRYKENLARLVRALRKDFGAPGAPFVLATLGQTARDQAGTGADGLIFEAQTGLQELPEFSGNAFCVYSKPFCHGGASNGHYNHNAETYMDVGLAMGRAMVDLLADDATQSPGPTGIL
ncbi:unnamed protein product [Pseudo-nitzschia multistriata]|uniref:Sialate O-acetylesterase domain-containing protein n=1 Tax=Pseudo-nitzschia multistriata TaxID=183589 RepID=A0A448ZDS2_9STRA|nr:unnamed protein product [Pseudo-nitzschia multistriata]